ncbi:hypothetical protein [Sulfobacillus thermosulfidooxidans]|uniref:hypothetical protein n=1 Tax=Sulfobacillus thermosulfidooxidans TaxID=28034 RepID=UPI0006B5EF9C|nr:hypothetical protein [Sulfobacillus thermosulfidooxidans]
MKSVLSVKSSALWGMLVAGLVYGGLSVLPWLRPLPRVPVVEQSYAQGTFLRPSDIHWIPMNRHMENLSPGYLKIALSPGEIVSPAMFSRQPQSSRGILVDIPSSSTFAQDGQKVRILVISASGHLWSSGPVTVIDAPHGNGLMGTGGGSLLVEMSWSQALTFEKLSVHGSVSVVGIQS